VSDELHLWYSKQRAHIAQTARRMLELGCSAQYVRDYIASEKQKQYVNDPEAWRERRREKPRDERGVRW
jgi:hypothetical protein